MEWIRGQTIGRGSTASVSLASAMNCPGRVFAVKSAEISHSLPLQKEQSILSKLSSPYIVNYLGFDISRENGSFLYNLWMECLPGGTLRELIAERGGFIDEPTIRSFVSRMVKGLIYLHANGIAHCDLKSQNVLIGEEGVKIADFGCAKLIGRNPTKDVFSGTPMFMSPEVARGEEQGFEADIWALGCLIIECATGMSPWSGSVCPVSLLYRIGYSDDVPDIPAWLSEEARDFLAKCLMRDPKKRWTVDQLAGHPFVKARRFDADSPITVLDRGFWDTTEVMALDVISELESSSNTGFCIVSDPTLATDDERIKKLNGDMADWADTADWFTIRSSDHERHELSLIDDVRNETPLISNDVVEAQDELLIAPNDSLYQLLSESIIAGTSNSDYVSSLDYNEAFCDYFIVLNLSFRISLLAAAKFLHNFLVRRGVNCVDFHRKVTNLIIS